MLRDAAGFNHFYIAAGKTVLRKAHKYVLFEGFCSIICMSNISFSEDELNSLSKDVLVKFYLQLQDNFQELSRQNDANTKELLKQISNLQEQIAILTNYRFGRETEKTSEMLDGQFTMDLNGKIRN